MQKINLFGYCAYHPNHYLQKFCAKNSCMLPLCEVCERIHQAEHKINQTQPNYYKLETVFEKAKNQLKISINTHQQIETCLTNLLFQLDSNQKDLKQQMKIRRNELINSFEEVLIQLQEIFLQQLSELQTVYLKQFQVLKMSHEESLKHISEELTHLELFSKESWSVLIECAKKKRCLQLDFQKQLPQINKIKESLSLLGQSQIVFKMPRSKLSKSKLFSPSLIQYFILQCKSYKQKQKSKLIVTK